jgi:hypothetical protein
VAVIGRMQEEVRLVGDISRHSHSSSDDLLDTPIIMDKCQNSVPPLPILSSSSVVPGNVGIRFRP